MQCINHLITIFATSIDNLMFSMADIENRGQSTAIPHYNSCDKLMPAAFAKCSPLTP